MAKITRAAVELDGGWNYTDWPGMANQAALDAFVDVQVAAASAYVKWRVGDDNYGDTAEPKASILAAAELQICQEALLRSAATVGASTANFAVGTADLSTEAHYRRRKAEELLAPYSLIGATPFARPASTAGTAGDAIAGGSGMQLSTDSNPHGEGGFGWNG